VLFLQEHWLSDIQLQTLCDIDTDFQCCGVSGFDNSDVLSGRPLIWRLCHTVAIGSVVQLE